MVEHNFLFFFLLDASAAFRTHWCDINILHGVIYMARDEAAHGLLANCDATLCRLVQPLPYSVPVFNDAISYPPALTRRSAPPPLNLMQSCHARDMANIIPHSLPDSKPPLDPPSSDTVLPNVIPGVLDVLLTPLLSLALSLESVLLPLLNLFGLSQPLLLVLLGSMLNVHLVDFDEARR